jgi:hypothetical protein
MKKTTARDEAWMRERQSRAAQERERLAFDAAVAPEVGPPPVRSGERATPPVLISANERHYTPKEIAKLWQLDPKTVRDIFRKEAGVLRIGNPNSTVRNRAYTTLRIPQSVLDRVHRRMGIKG